MPDWIIKGERRTKAAVAAFLETIPEDVRTDLMRYGSRQWHLLNLHARCPGAADLSRSNPALAFALANNWIFHTPAVNRPYRAARSLVNRKQKVIQEWLGFPGTEPVRRILAKIESHSVSVEALLYLRQSISNPWVRGVLSHAERIDDCTLRLATDERLRPFVTPRLIEDFCRSSDDAGEPASLYVFWDTLEMAERFGWRDCPRRFESNRHLRAVHDKLAARLAGMPHADWEPDLFPPPPYEGTTAIMPICTPEDLREEGRLMNHCAAIRAPNVAAGWMYMYRVMKPVRATLAVVRVRDEWFCREIRGPGNAPISREIKKAVMAALLATPRSGEETLERWRQGVTRATTPTADPVDWNAAENARRIASLPAEDQRLYERYAAVLGSAPLAVP